MRIAVVSDIHGNLTALEAVLADLRGTSPDVIFHGGDVPHGGSSPAAVVDIVRELGWKGVAGNTDEMLWDPASLTEFAKNIPPMQTLLPRIEEMAAWTRAELGSERIEWLRGFPRTLVKEPMALVHASPASTWVSPGLSSRDEEFASAYGPLGKAVVVFGHVHTPFVRRMGEMMVVNTGSVSLSYDADARAAYLLLDDGTPVIRRVEYDVEREIAMMRDRRIPHAEWIAKALRSARPEMP